MPVSTGLAIYFIIWWLVLFAVLPWGVRSQHEDGNFVEGTDPGAPVVPALGRKLIWTTLVSAILFAILDLLYVYRVASLEDLVTLWGWLK